MICEPPKFFNPYSAVEYPAGDCLNERPRKGEPPTLRILRCSIPEPNSGCWLWLGTLNQHGYGHVDARPRRRSAHRASYEAFRGSIPDGMCVLHRCDVPACVNPAHLFLGTHADNMRDRDAKGRGRHPRGEQHGRAKVTEEDVRAIRDLARAKVLRQDIAARFGLNVGTVNRIVRGHYWRHVP